MNGSYGLKPWFQGVLQPVEEWLVSRRVHPDHLTLAAVGLAGLGGLALALATWQPLLLLLVPPLVLARTALNALDGLVARRLGLARPWGEVLNEVADRLADLALLGGVVAALPLMAAPLGLATIAAVLLASYVGIVGKAAGGRRQYGGIMGKADRLLLLAVAAPLALLLGTGPIFTGTLGLILAGALLTIVQRLRLIRAELG